MTRRPGFYRRAAAIEESMMRASMPRTDKADPKGLPPLITSAPPQEGREYRKVFSV